MAIEAQGKGDSRGTQAMRPNARGRPPNEKERGCNTPPAQTSTASNDSIRLATAQDFEPANRAYAELRRLRARGVIVGGPWATAGGADLPAMAGDLPQLATLPVIIGHAQKADLVWTDEQFRDLCLHMLNGNPDNFFLMPYRDSKTGEPEYAKARKASARHRIQWAWDTVRGTAGAKASVGFYPRNGDGESRWAAMDFDAHDGDKQRARDLAFKAFAALFKHPELFLVLCTSGGDGWHLFVFTVNFHPVAKWSLLLRNVADLIGAPVEKGLLEIFPDGKSQGLGYGIRAPGTWNPKSDEVGLIAYERVTELLEHPALSAAKEKNTSLSVRALRREEGPKCPYSAKTPYRGTLNEWQQLFAITAPRSRHGKLSKLVGTAFFQAGHDVARENARLQYAEAAPAPATPLEKHLEEFKELWSGLERDWLAELSATERRRFDALTTDTERDAFRIIRNWSRADNDAHDFKIQVESLAARIGLSIRGAGTLRRRFCSLGILRQTAPYVPHKLAARYEWKLF